MTTPDPLASITPEDLIALIERGLDADEQAAKRVQQPYRLYACDDGHIEEPMLVDDPWGERNGEYQQWEPGEDRLPNHHNSWALIYDPSRVLADVESKRAIVAEYAHWVARMNEIDYPDQRDVGHMEAMETAVRLLARPYLDQETP